MGVRGFVVKHVFGRGRSKIHTSLFEFSKCSINTLTREDRGETCHGYFHVRGNLHLIVVDIHTTVRGVVEVCIKGCLSLIFVLINVKEILDGFTDDFFGCIRSKKVLNGYQPVDNTTEISRSWMIRGCTVLTTGTFWENLRDQYNEPQADLPWCPAFRLVQQDVWGRQWLRVFTWTCDPWM